MAKKKETDLVEEIREEEPLETKGPLRDDPAPEYVPAWEVVNDRQNILADKIPPKIYSLDALIAAGVVNETNLAAYLEDNGYVKNTDYGTPTVGGTVKGNLNQFYITTAGAPQAGVSTAALYPSLSGNNFISKGTLENIKQLIVESALSLFCDATSSSAAVGTKLSDLTMTKTENGWVISFDTLTPPLP